MIGKLDAHFLRRATSDDGDIELTFKVDKSSRWACGGIVSELKSRINREDDTVTLTIDEPRRKRSLAQNRMMWALLELMARAQGLDAWDCYLDMLERFGGEFEYIHCQKKAIPRLKEMFRSIRIVEDRERDTVMCKAYVGSSKFTTAQMTSLIDGIIDVLSDMEGVDTKELSYLINDWRLNS